ncbi:MAG: N-acetylmuramoyl-L-alanine amidase [Fibrella sp.]|nr:N-acetylmuramoyl-L-alanine amidase [Armatimonadota bacterium]
MSVVFDELVARYKAGSIMFPALKPVTLAQWILESGRGTSGLATMHLNFGGLKWRSEMVGFATPIEHNAHDGIDFYCKFSSSNAFIVGYWKFLSRSPYDGWEDHAHDPEAFIRFIGDIYTPAVGYADQVIALIPEATQRLAQAPNIPVPPPVPPVAGTPTVIVIDPGHGGTVAVDGSSANNARSPSGELEKNWTLDVAKRTRVAVLAKALSLGKNVEVVLTRETDINKGLTARANVARSRAAKLFLSIHFNGFNAQVRGLETLIHPINVNIGQDRTFAQAVQTAVLGALHQIDPTTPGLPSYNRGVKEQRLGVLNDVALGNTVASHPCRACLVEIEFMDTSAVEQLFRLSVAATAVNRQKIADALADALLTQV